MTTYLPVNNLDQAKGACPALRNKIDTLGLSDRDEALILWSQLHQNTNLGADPGLDDIPCMLSVAANLPWPPPPPPVPAKTGDMKGSADDIADFFVLNTWDQRADDADQLFSYPLAFDDPKHLILTGATAIRNDTDWLTYIANKNVAILPKFGCYAFFENKGDANFTVKYGKDSFMAAVGQLPGDGPEKDAAILFWFAPVGSGKVRIEKVMVADDLPADVKSLMLAQYKSRGSCSSGWKPPLLFSSL